MQHGHSVREFSRHKRDLHCLSCAFTVFILYIYVYAVGCVVLHDVASGLV